MTVAGMSWGGYTLFGRKSKHPLCDTAYNFLRTLPFVVILFLITFQNSEISNKGVWLAVLSGGVTSGLGYTVWYLALGGLSETQAAVVQLLVPVIAAVGGVLFANELISARLVISSTLILGGVLAVILAKRYRNIGVESFP